MVLVEGKRGLLNLDKSIHWVVIGYQGAVPHTFRTGKGGKTLGRQNDSYPLCASSSQCFDKTLLMGALQSKIGEVSKQIAYAVPSQFGSDAQDKIIFS